ncbi:nuclear transport factor 2 family protein [Solidesulfovibrio magneticus]|uniref:SnoaL-like domain-containing protein n=1 Tax=Solidesulfovibrio magneticus (strain ATCC 700980 / DSM 13731 / RS-1) TaxID=573370 RepID=C4XMX6_SOLM1|nr:nuclear transport factor 2 family protein [Solidesulfovibrio magneticus]BAH77279.1 hypothetical protein DMR_37880 [Solidesulfovibrio magneticus RS-1]
MPSPLPQPVADYFAASNASDLLRLERCFADNAVVRDEGREHHGPKAIADWHAQTKQQYRYKTEVLDSRGHSDAVTVKTRVAGDFPGSPVELEQRFCLSPEGITALEIKPCQ